MENIIYNGEIREIQFKGEITSFIFYNQFFEALKDHYIENGFNNIPIFSFIHVSFFDPLVIPNLVGIGIILNKVHDKEKIKLNFARIDSTKFLDDIWFFENIGKEKQFCEEVPTLENGIIINKPFSQNIGLSIYEFDENKLGFYNNKTYHKRNNPEHKVRIYSNDSLQYYLKYIEPNITQEELDAIRTDKYTELKPFIQKHFYNILQNIDNAEQVLKVLTELICNSILYSDSVSAVMLQSKNGKTKISVSDFGVGFEYSFNLKEKKFGYKYSIFDQFSKIDQEKYKNYLYIFEAIHYSKSKSDYRENLFTLLKGVITSYDGIIRIHYIDTQVVFTSKRCRNCDKKLDPSECVNCLFQKISADNFISPVRFNYGKLKGVHIEVELNY